MTQHLKTTALTIAVACIIVCLPAKGVAQDARIAVVDTRELTLMSEEGKLAGDKLQKRLDVIRIEMDKLRKEIEEKDNTLRTRERLLSAQAKATLTKEIEDGKFKFEQKAQVYEKEMNEMQAELLDPIANKIQLELQSYVKEKSYTLVVDLADNANVVWANSGNNITKDVLVRINESFKRAGGVPKAPASTTPPAATTPPAGQRPPAATPAAPPPAATPADPK
jgi:Skp family chaperone for outer membrane proteins